MNKNEYKESLNGLEIAIIGLEGRFPGAKNLTEYWENLKNGIETVSFFSKQELLENGLESEIVENKNYVRAKGIIEGIEYFDSAFFGFTPKEAQMLDPQVRIFLQTAWSALEGAGYNPDGYKGLISLFAGHTNNIYWTANNHIMSLNGPGEFVASSMNTNFFSTLCSYKLNLKGPSVTINTACSTSLVSVHMACRSLLTGESDIALAGGVTITLPQKQGYVYQDGMVMSRDGHCRAFDEKADGIVNGDGIGVVVLKRLSDAIKDNDNIHAVIKGSAINNDGDRKVGYTAPSIEGQAEVIRAVFAMAEISPETVTYVEAHGTGTNFGDPVEIEALKNAFNTNKRQYCGIGSVKTNLGHLDCASGIASLIKVVLSLKNKQIPPTLNFSRPNPKIDFQNSPFYVNDTLKEWDTENILRRAGVSSFGIGGTNAHLVLEEAVNFITPNTNEGYQMICLSAKTEESLINYCSEFKKYLSNNNTPAFADIAYTLNTGRKRFNHRKTIICDNSNDLVESLMLSQSESVFSYNDSDDRRKRTIFMFSGQGSQYANMGKDLYENNKVFRDEMDQCFSILNDILDYNIKDVIYPLDKDPQSNKAILEIDKSPVAIFIYEYSLAKLLMHWGITPHAIIGHSIGEYVVACLSGVFKLVDALRIVVYRGTLMKSLPGGVMMSVPMRKQEIVAFLNENISLAADHGESCLVSGSEDKIAELEKLLREKRYICQRLNISHAGHSKVMELMKPQFEAFIREIPLSKPEIPYVSTVTGNWVAYEDAISPTYWSNHLCETVNFAEGIKLLMESGNDIFLEIGAGNVLSTIAIQYKKKDDNKLIANLCKHAQQNITDQKYLLLRLAKYWLYGGEMDWGKYYEHQERHKVTLPTYAFDTKSFSVEIPSLKKLISNGISNVPKELSKKNIEDWFYLPSWKTSYLPEFKNSTNKKDSICLVFVNTSEFSVLLLDKLKSLYAKVITISEGANFMQVNDNDYVINSFLETDYLSLFTNLNESGTIPRDIVHLWNYNESEDIEKYSEKISDYNYKGFYSLFFTAKALGKILIGKNIYFHVAGNNIFNTSGTELINPAKSTLIGAIKGVTIEYPNIICKYIDASPSNLKSFRITNQIENVIKEICCENMDQMVAYRGKQRLVQSFESIALGENLSPVFLKDKGVYIITGGLGGIALEIAKYLATNYQATLLLIGRSSFPDRKDWGNILKQANTDIKTIKKIEILSEIEAQSSGLYIYQSDITDSEMFQKIVSDFESQHSLISGVIHCAGYSQGGIAQTKSVETVEKVFASKITGTILIDKTFKNHSLDFFAICSSLNSIIPGIGLIDYCAANAFIDGFANYSSLCGKNVLSINWDAWQSIGGAFDGAQMMAKSLVDSKQQILPATSPLFKGYLKKDNSEIYISKLLPSEDWVLSDHQIMDTPTLPGTAYLELISSALGNKIAGKELEISDMYFLKPMTVRHENSLIINTIFKFNSDHDIEFKICSHTDDEIQWKEHCNGKIRINEAPAINNVDLVQLEKNVSGIFADLNVIENQKDVPIQFGNRWLKNYKLLKYNKNEKFIELQLPDEFAQDIVNHQLHPALLDTAFSVISENGTYLPFSYEKIKIYGNLPNKIYSYVKLNENKDSANKYITLDIKVYNQNGKLLIDLKNYTLLAVTESTLTADSRIQGGKAIQGISEEKNYSELVMPDNDSVIESMVSKHLKNGITPNEGVLAFSRVINTSLPQIVVSTTDFNQRLIESGIKKSSNDTLNVPDGSNGSTPEVKVNVPQNELEILIADLWKNYLGIDTISVFDNFFDLGANSVAIIQVTNKIKEKVGKDLPVVTMYIHPTIRELAKYLSGNSEEMVTEDLDVNVLTSRREKLQQRKRKLIDN
jgi:acyl transferase domain-containing protein